MSELHDVLVVDDDALIRDTLQFALRRDFNVMAAASRAEAHEVLRALPRPPGLALVDLGLPPAPDSPEEGFQLIRELVACAPEMKIVVLSGQTGDAHARHARTLGAMEFVAKPCEPQRLRTLLLDSVRLNGASARTGAAEFIGDSAPLQKVRQQIELYAHAPFPVLIQGESGSGKERVAQALHARGPRVARPLYALNCAAISATLVEASLFGYAKGAFTGATASRAGYFEDAHDSTLLLDEIGELPLELQAKLLRVLENGQYQRVGETTTRTSAARIVAATNRDLRREVRDGRFRADLYHRLSVFTIDVPPLRELTEDKIALLEHFQRHYAAQAGSAPFVLDSGAQALWLDYAFPGNVRELRNIVIRLITKHAGQPVTATMLRDELDTDNGSEPVALPGISQQRDLLALAQRQLERSSGFVLDDMLHQWERTYVDAALAATGGNLTRAARLLGIQRTTLYSRMQSYATAVSRRTREQG
ncbi:MAG TPA: sigma-54 dependent transcriptional regulator [Burkholderiales bacterium]|nr:sigma-54 dependent transcriptional regulator [Burkholderiales bacterium]